MGDMETDSMREIGAVVARPDVDILFAPHHGRASGRVPADILRMMSPQTVVAGEAPALFWDYYPGYNTTTRNSAGSIAFDCGLHIVDIYVTSDTCRANYLQRCLGKNRYQNCIGNLTV